MSEEYNYRESGDMTYPFMKGHNGFNSRVTMFETITFYEKL